MLQLHGFQNLFDLVLDPLVEAFQECLKPLIQLLLHCLLKLLHRIVQDLGLCLLQFFLNQAERAHLQGGRFPFDQGFQFGRGQGLSLSGFPRRQQGLSNAFRQPFNTVLQTHFHIFLRPAQTCFHYTRLFLFHDYRPTEERLLHPHVHLHGLGHFRAVAIVRPLSLMTRPHDARQQRPVLAAVLLEHTGIKGLQALRRVQAVVRQGHIAFALFSHRRGDLGVAGLHDGLVGRWEISQ